VQLHLGRDERRRKHPGATQLQLGEGTVAVGLKRPQAVGVELGVIGQGRHVEAAHVGAVVAPDELRQPVVGRRDGRGHVLQGLPLEHAHAGREIAFGPAEVAVVGQQTLGQRGGSPGEITPVVVIAHPVECNVQAQAAHGGVDRPVVQGRIAPAVAVAQSVLGQVLPQQLAAVILFKVTELTAQVHAAARQQRGGKCGIAVGRDVPVIRQRDLRAAHSVQPDDGWQQARLAAVRQRKAHGRQWQDRHILEAQHRAFGHTHLLVVVDLDRIGVQNPVGQPANAGFALAGGVVRVVDDGALVVQKIDPAGLAIGVVFQKTVAGLGEEAFERIDLELQRRAAVGVARAVDAHVATGLGLVVGLVVLHVVGADHRGAAAQHGVAFDHGFQIGAAAHPVARDEGWHLGAHRCGPLLLQQPTGFELDGPWRFVLRPGRRAVQQRADHAGQRRQRKTRPRAARGAGVLHGGQWNGHGRRDVSRSGAPDKHPAVPLGDTGARPGL